MSELDRIRDQFRDDSTDIEAATDDTLDDTELDDLLTRVDVAPSEITIELLLDQAPEMAVPRHWLSDWATRWAIVSATLDSNTPELGALLRQARTAANVRQHEAAAVLEWDPTAYERLEDGRAPGSLTNATPDSVGRLAALLNINPALLVSAASKAVVSASGLGYGHRPRARPDDAVSMENRRRDRERLNEWAKGVLAPWR